LWVVNFINGFVIPYGMADSKDLIGLFEKLQEGIGTLSTLEKDASSVFRETLDVILDDVFSNEEFIRLYGILNESEEKANFTIHKIHNSRRIVEGYEETENYQSLTMARYSISGFMILKHKKDKNFEIYCSIPQDKRGIPNEKSFANEENDQFYEGQWLPYYKITREDLCKARTGNNSALFLDFYAALIGATERAIGVIDVKRRLYEDKGSGRLSNEYETRKTRLVEFATTLKE
jgi:hypothetical protein